MTAAELHENPYNNDASYEGGFSIPGPNFKDSAHFRVESDEGCVDLHVQQSGNGHGISSIYQRISPGEARELALALERAAGAAENAIERRTG